MSVISVLGATSTADTLSLAEPLVAVALAVLLLGERLTPLTFVDGSLLLAGIVFASLPSLRQPARVDALVEAAS